MLFEQIDFSTPGHHFMQDFLSALSAAGYRPKNGHIVSDNSWHRLYFMDEKGGGDSGRYVLREQPDGFVFGSYGSEKDPQGFQAWHSKMGGELSKAERQELTARLKREKAEAEKERRAAYEAAARGAQEYWKGLKPAAGNEYSARKGIVLEGIRQDGDTLVIPMFRDGNIVSLQEIRPDGFKKFRDGCSVQGAYFPLATRDEDKSKIIIAEGWGTAASIRMATGLPVVVAFTAGNLLEVARSMKKKYPDSRFIFAADGDFWSFSPTGHKGAGSPDKKTVAGDDPHWVEWRAAGFLYNAGVEKATKAAAAIGGAFVVDPGFGDNDPGKRTDFSDLHLSAGLDAVRERILGVVPPAPPPEEAPDGIPGPGHDLQPVGGDAGDYPDPHETDEEKPFKILGHSDGHYYFLPRSSGQIVKLSPTALGSMVNLFRLCPLHYWQDHFGAGEESSRKIAEFAANALITTAHEVGIFRPSNIRGIGAWLDDGRNILHCGDTLMVDGVSVKPHKLPSRFVYPLMSATVHMDAEPLSNRSAIRLREICSKLSWESKLSGDLLAGWCVIAPVCAAIPWRPHIWITGESQSGKTTVLENIVSNMVGAMALHVEGGTTEAALRQMLGFDGRPVIYDEAEAETMKDKTIMEGLMQLVRRSSSGGKIVKGSASGEAVQYTLRASFCFSGINPVIKHRADESRITQLVLKKAAVADADQYYQGLRQEIRETLTPEFGRGLLARTINNLGVLVGNCRAFADAASDVLCDRRAADQIGAMLAGLYLLSSTAAVDHDKAVAWIRAHDWTTHTAIAEQSDPERLIMFIATKIIRYVFNGTNREATIGTLIQRALGRSKDCLTPDQDAENILRTYGIWPKAEGVLIANKSPNLENLLKDTPWHSWARTLADLGGAEKHAALYFAPGFSQRSVRVPLAAFGIGEGR